jgi:hypothetical protein
MNVSRYRFAVEPVTAQSYVNAWNATAYGPNATFIGPKPR